VAAVLHQYASIVTMQGLDVAGQLYWSWEWHDGDGGFVTPDPGSLATALKRLTFALPQPGKPLGCVDGAFGSPEGERSLARELGALLLHPKLVEQLRNRLPASGVPSVLMQILPSTSCAQVPWEILSTDPSGYGDERLLEMADIVTMAPLLTRDGVPLRHHPDWSARARNPPVYLIDPSHGPRSSGVLADGQDEKWRQLVSETGAIMPEWAVQSSRATPANVGAALHTEPRPSRFFYLGHVEANETEPTMTSMLVRGDHGQTRRFSALEWLVDFGTLQDEHAADTEIAADSWPMPPRVALIACGSGTDFAQIEPFGLVTAILELGAELVTATRWTMLTDVAFASLESTMQPFNDLALKIDELQRGDDPIHGLCDWQRARLHDWRRHSRDVIVPDIGDSPLTWAAVTNFYAPDRTVPGEGSRGTGPDFYDEAG
jgi:hypothetical protein